jgi:hypothetical protein
MPFLRALSSSRPSTPGKWSLYETQLRAHKLLLLNLTLDFASSQRSVTAWFESLRTTPPR